MRLLTVFGLLLGVCGLLGCSDQAATQSRQATSDDRTSRLGLDQVAQKAQAPPPQALRPAGLPADNEKAVKKPDADLGLPNGAIARKKIATGSIELKVEEYDRAVTRLKTEVNIADGYIANSDDSGASGGPRVGTYTVRVPAKEFDRFMDALASMGEVRRRTSDTQDITDQYYDTETRIKNDKAREQSLLKLYDRTLAEKSTVAERTQLTHELFDLRRSIEQQEASLKRWDSQTAYSTVVVQISQRTEYEAAGTPSFGTTITRTWDKSLNALGEFGKALLIIAVAVAPWLGVFAVVTVPLWIFLWRRVRKAPSAKRPTPTPPAPPQAEPPVAALPA